jgi:biopolymer transport protein ExbD
MPVMSKSTNNLYSRRASIGDDNMIPLINIVFLLLIFFMVAGKISVDYASDIDLPISNIKYISDVYEINIVLDAEGIITLNGKLAALESLSENIFTLIDKGDSVVALQADAHVKAKQLTPIIKIIRAAGVKKVRLFTRAGDKS